MTNKKILFTGGNGFIGRQIIPLIEKAGYDVVRPRSTQVRLEVDDCLLYTSPSPRDQRGSRMPSSA